MTDPLDPDSTPPPGADEPDPATPPPPPAPPAPPGFEPLFAQPSIDNFESPPPPPVPSLTFDLPAEPPPPPPPPPPGFGNEPPVHTAVHAAPDFPMPDRGNGMVPPPFEEPGAVAVAAPPAPPAPAVPEGRTALVKPARDRSAGDVATAVARRYVWVVAVVVVAVLVANFLPSARATQVTSAVAANNNTVTLGTGMTPATQAYASGTTVGGVACGPGVRQVPWSAYAPPCQPAWHGNNGGATTRGVTGSTITLSYRAASTAQLAELYGLIPPSVVGTNQEAVHTLQAYINTFNKSFELYGRKVVLVPFNGKGDFIDEDLGMDQSQAQEDAVTVAQSIKAFADMSGVDASALYASDLGAQSVVTTSLYENDLSWYQQNAPYEFSPGPNCTKMAQATGAVLGKQLGGLPASFAGDPALQGSTRVFGMISPLNPEAATCAADDETEMAHFGHPITKAVTVKFDLSSLIATSNAAVAEMKAAGVTTVILSSSDPITPKFFMQAADADHYYPEWWMQSYFAGGQTNNDSFTRLFPADQIKDVIGLGTQTQPLSEQEGIKAYNLGNTTPGMKPLPAFFWMYQSIVQFYDALQLAGPDLTPGNFEAAMKKIPQSKSWGMFMGWDGATGPYDPGSQYGVVKYSLDDTSPLDGQPGTYISCDGGQLYSYSASGSGVPQHQQLTCAKTASTSAG